MPDTFKRILLPVDFSDHSDVVAQHAAWFAKQGTSTVHMVHVVSNPTDETYQPNEAPYWMMVEHAQQKARELMDAAARRSLPAECSVTLHVEVGDPYANIMQVVGEVHPDLIVMSTHGRSGIAHLVMGSVAEKVVRHSPCPVFVVPRQAQGEES